MIVDTVDRQTIRAAVELGSHAPSLHNSQPWRWRLDGRSLLLQADLRRWLPATDADGRRGVHWLQRFGGDKRPARPKALSARKTLAIGHRVEFVFLEIDETQIFHRLRTFHDAWATFGSIQSGSQW